MHFFLQRDKLEEAWIIAPVRTSLLVLLLHRRQIAIKSLSKLVRNRYGAKKKPGERFLSELSAGFGVSGRLELFPICVINI